jgi:hypothetical protein
MRSPTMVSPDPVNCERTNGIEFIVFLSESSRPPCGALCGNAPIAFDRGQRNRRAILKAMKYLAREDLVR